VKHDNTLHIDRLRDDGQGEIESVKAKLEEGSEAHASLEEEMKSRDADIRTLQASCTDLPFSCYQLPAEQHKPHCSKVTISYSAGQFTTGAE